MELALFAAPVAMLLAWMNGANDNIKGAATLVGSGLSSAHTAIVLAAVATAVGGLVSILLLMGLLQVFSGQGIVPDSLAGSAEFLVPVGLGAALTVGTATRLGLPVSTTHALVGGLLGAGLMAVPANIQLGAVLFGMAVPLVVVPLAALVLALAMIPFVRHLRRRFVAREDICICRDVEIAGHENGCAYARMETRVATASAADCQPTAGRSAVHIAQTRVLDGAHVVSALSVCFARGLNDTPKIAAIGLASAAFGVVEASLVVIVAMALGGLLASWRVTEVLAWRITRMDAAEGLGANLVTAGLVTAASVWALPVSTTHVSGGALFGIAAGNRSGRGRTISMIALAWVLTLPLGAAFGALFYTLLNGLGL